ncbi:hypothetical protein [Parageobacillus thermoglucosidasius]|uniref:hypothetical protein n=1 Tax=Parageobacillus thermoglucosidasius TaxID=1426 RepID=UPI0027F68961|nr:hypothetical protein PthstB1num2_28010 [Parageobacillus thermoglucosidasius]
MQMVMQRGFTWRGSHDNLFGFAKSVTAGRLAKESWLQRLHVKPSIARIQIEFLCNINEFIYCNTLHFFLAKNSGERFYEAIEDIVSLSEDEFSVESDNVFILVSSLFNGIEKTHVQQLLNQPIDSNYDFLTNRNLVDTFLDKYISAIEILPQPKEQIYFLASELHPNVIANDLLNKEIDNDTFMDHINNYRWLSSISKLMKSIEEKS